MLALIDREGRLLGLDKHPMPVAPPQEPWNLDLLTLDELLEWERLLRKAQGQPVPDAAPAVGALPAAPVADTSAAVQEEPAFEVLIPPEAHSLSPNGDRLPASP